MRKLLLFVLSLCISGYAGAQCAASLTATPNPIGNDLLNYSFNNTSSYGLPFSGQIKSFVVSYGDGATATGSVAIPDHVYTAPGTYIVDLTIYSIDSVTNTQVCTDTAMPYIAVAYPACGTRITYTSSGAVRNFLATTPGGSTGMSYSWNFGDGGTGTGSSPSHTYASAGLYTVTLTATNTANACSYTNTATIYVSLPPAPLSCSSLSASFTASVTGNVATITNTSSTVSSPYVRTADWNFGDGSFSTAINPPAHTYSTVGVYNVSLITVWRDSFMTTVCRDTVVQTVAITSIPTPPNLISGQVRYDSATYGINNFKVWLIKLDSATYTLYAVDSQITANTANAYYAFANKPAGYYLTKAAVYLGSTSGTGLVPTYHDSSAFWYAARQINHNGGSSLGRNIYMQTGTLTSGPGFISGMISLGANKGTASGVAGVEVYLRNSQSRVVTRTFTDAQGNYSFPNLARGAYSVYPEKLNFATTPITPIVLTAGNDTSIAANFSYDETRRSIVPGNGLSVVNVSRAPGIHASPVPAHDNINISWVSPVDGELQFVVTSYTGQTVARTESRRGVAGTINLSLRNLAPGIYFLHGTGVLKGAVTRIVVQ